MSEKGWLLLQHVPYSPKIHKNIVSIGSHICDGHHVKIENRRLMVTDSTMHDITFTLENDLVLYYLTGCHLSNADLAKSTQSISNSEKKDTPTKLMTLDINLAHDIYGHIGEAALRSTLKVIGINVTGKLNTCEGCFLAKAKAKPVSKLSTVKVTKPGE